MPNRKRLKKLIDALPLTDRTGEAIIELLREAIKGDADLIQDICPGKRLVPIRMTPAERTKVAAQAAAEAAQKAAAARYLVVVPIIKEILNANPDASLAEIKRELDKSGIPPVRSAQWSRASINFIMTKAELRAKDQS
ncbi:hypothetical protein HJA82_29550 [Rhizobium bangladeshense]|uniref:hypothetical protein n=1 Tax=Rhizobium bangladeshense TaxID=1138189 RepID=UPI001C83E1E0|nr:hypothetical protein [Rhizobium bangladeshense]MBX4911462.1 hypothetical protein [Rhizobium bangladeshense]